MVMSVYNGILFTVLIASPVFCNLPPIIPNSQQQQSSQQSPFPQPQPQGQPSPGSMQAMLASQIQNQNVQPTTPPPITFNFDGFFNFFMQNYGKPSLKYLAERLKDKMLREGVISPGPSCPSAQAVEGAMMQYMPNSNSRESGSTVTYTCQQGYRGTQVELRCENGQWTTPPTPPSCQKITCSVPPQLQNGQQTSMPRLPSMPYQIGEQVSFSCKPGFQADHVARPIVCQGDGTWTQIPFRCTNMLAMTNPAFGMGGMPNMMGGMPGQPGGGMMSMLSSMMGGGPIGPMAGAMGGGGGMASMLSSMMGPGAGGMSPGQLPPHLAALGSVMPFMNNAMKPGMNMLGGMGGAGAAGGAAAPAGEPAEQKPEQMMMAMMMQQMMMQNMQQQRQRQMEMMQKQQQQQQMMQQMQNQASQQTPGEGSGQGTGPASAPSGQNSNSNPNGINLANLMTGQGAEKLQAMAKMMQQMTGGGGAGGQANMFQSALQSLAAASQGGPTGMGSLSADPGAAQPTPDANGLQSAIMALAQQG